jgi:hypothetical protein
VVEAQPDLQSGYEAFHFVQPFEAVSRQFLDELIAFYGEVAEPRLLDATVNQGRIWGRGKSRYKHTGMDIRASIARTFMFLLTVGRRDE